MNADTPLWFANALAHPRREERVAVAGATLQMSSWNDDETSKPPLLLVHGFLASSRWWDAIAPGLTDRFRVYACDLSGMGDSTHRPSYRHADWSGELVRIAESLGADVRIVGHSFGGARALEACVLRPDSFTRLVVVDSYLHLAAPRPTRQGSWSIHTAARNYPDFATALARYRLVPPEEPPRYMFQHAARHAALRHATGWGWKFDPRLLSEQRMHEDARPLLHDLRVPMTVVHGTRSGVMPPSLVEDVLRLCPMSQRALAIADAGHHLPLTHPLELLGALREVLDHRWGAPVTQPRQVAAIKPLSGDMRP